MYPDADTHTAATADWRMQVGPWFDVVLETSPPYPTYRRADRMTRPILVWVILEIHCYLLPAGQLSVWISGRKPPNDKTLEEDVAVRLVGPVPGDEGERIVRALHEQLGVAGITVIEKAAADD
jgi:hypothetical protein